MANEISASFSIRGVQGNQGNASLRSSNDSAIPVRIAPLPATEEVKPESVSRPDEKDFKTGHTLPLAEENVRFVAAEEVSKEEEKELKSALRDVNEHMQNIQRNLQFEVDKESNQTIVRVVDTQSGEVVRQIPAEEVIRMAKRMEEMDGLLMSEHA